MSTKTTFAPVAVIASDVAMKVATDSVQVMAGEGYSKDYPVEKIMRDVKLCQISLDIHY